jgi:L,D-transpeptidase catalytic domain
MKVLFSILITISLITAISLSANKRADAKRTDPAGHPKKNNSWVKKNEEKLKTYAATAKDFVRLKKYNPDYCFLVDMSLASGQPRFFIYDLAKDSVLQSGLVAHGNCYQDWLEGRKYSNKVGSGCTSLGRYRIGIPYTGMWGYSYKLHGLDSSNNNAFERTVVLHGHRCVPSEGVEEEICQSNGCPTVAPDFLLRLKELINSSAKPVLLWIYQ